jgi:hypothetical protein
MCAKHPDGLCASAPLWLALNAIALGQPEQAKLQVVGMHEASHVELVQALLDRRATQVSFSHVPANDAESYARLRLYWIAYQICLKQGRAELAQAFKALAETRAKTLHVSAEGVFRELLSKGQD